MAFRAPDAPIPWWTSWSIISDGSAPREFYNELKKDKPMKVYEERAHQPQARTHFKVGSLYYHKPTGTILLCVTTRYGKAKDDNIRCIVIKPGPGVSNTNIGWMWIPRTVSNYELYNGTLTLINDQTGNS